MQEIISLREFARRTDVTEKTIRDGIKLNKLKNCITYKNGLPKIIYDIALVEFENSGLGTRAKMKKEPVNFIESSTKKETTIVSNNEENAKEEIGGLNSETSLATAVRIEKIYKAQLACMEVDEKAGILVNKQDVYTELFNFGRELRNALLAIPDRIVDNIISKHNDRDFIRLLLNDSISKELERFSKYEN